MRTLDIEKTADMVENDVTRFEFCDDVYVVDSSREFSVVCARSASARFSVGDDFRESLTPEETEALRHYLLSFESRPMLLRTDEGLALVYADAFPSTLNFLICYPDIVGELESSDIFALGSELGIFVPPIYGFDGEMRRADKKAAARIRQSMVAAEAVFKRDELSMTLGGQNILGILTRAALDAASFSGCGVSVGVPADITLGDGFDRHLFGMFLLLFFMSARENSPERRARVVMSDGFEGLVVRAECEIFEDRAYRIMPLINTVSSFSERYNIRCSCALNGNRLTVEFCPVRKDWSLLDMKTSFVFDWKS